MKLHWHLIFIPCCSFWVGKCFIVSVRVVYSKHGFIRYCVWAYLLFSYCSHGLVCTCARVHLAAVGNGGSICTGPFLILFHSDCSYDRLLWQILVSEFFILGKLLCGVHTVSLLSHHMPVLWHVCTISFVYIH